MELSKDETLVPYTMVRQHEERLNVLAQSVMALVDSLKATVPGFEESYARHHAERGNRLLQQDLPPKYL